MSARSLLNSLCRDTENGILLGVCAGIADSLGLNTAIVRLLALVGLVLFFIPVVVLYIAAGALLRERPLHYRGQGDERWFWGSGHGET